MVKVEEIVPNNNKPQKNGEPQGSLKSYGISIAICVILYLLMKDLKTLELGLYCSSAVTVYVLESVIRRDI